MNASPQATLSASTKHSTASEWSSIWDYGRQLLKDGWFIFFLLLSIGSTAATYIPHFSMPRWAPAAAAFVAFVVAPYRVFRRQRTVLNERESHIAQLRHQIAELEQELRVGPQANQRLISSVIQVARQRIQEWQHANVSNLAATHSLPKTINLVPEKAMDAVEEAGKLSVEAGAELTNAFECLRRATSEIEVLYDFRMMDPNSLTGRVKAFAGHLEMAEQHIQFAEDHLGESGGGTPARTAFNDALRAEFRKAELQWSLLKRPDSFPRIETVCQQVDDFRAALEVLYSRCPPSLDSQPLQGAIEKLHTTLKFRIGKRVGSKSEADQIVDLMESALADVQATIK